MSVNGEQKPQGIKLPPDYGITMRVLILRDFQRWATELSRVTGKTLSANRATLIIDDILNEYSYWLHPDASPEFKIIYKDRLDPQTIRKMLTCPLDISVVDLNRNSIRVADAVTQIVANDPPIWHPPFTLDPARKNSLDKP